jgi:hypothetical protein
MVSVCFGTINKTRFVQGINLIFLLHFGMFNKLCLHYFL